MKILVPLLMALLLSSKYSHCQEYGYTHYAVKEGLVGSMVYCITQDKDGFLWFGTETGLSRFDGTHFRNFTMEDGLPDNEIIKLFADSKGRIWMAPFKKSVCYYYNGRIHNQGNDSLLKKLVIKNNLFGFAEDEKGNILMSENNRLHLVRSDGTVQAFDFKEENLPDSCISISRSATGGFHIFAKDRIVAFNHNRFFLQRQVAFPFSSITFVAMSQHMLVYRNSMDSTAAESFLSGETWNGPYSQDEINLSIIDSIHFAMCKKGGATLFNINFRDSSQNFLPGVPVSCVMKDIEGNTWFTTLGQGVYRLNSEHVLNITVSGKNASHESILSITGDNKSVIAGSATNTLLLLYADSGKTKFRILPPGIKGSYSRIVDLYRCRNNSIIYCTDQEIMRLSPQYKEEAYLGVVTSKALYMNEREDQLLVASNKNVLMVDPQTLAVRDTIWHERATTVFACGDTVYIGTLNGLYCLFPDRSIEFMGKQFPVFTNRIAGLRKSADGTIWVATYGAGIVAFKNRKIIAHLTRQNGLGSNNCRTIFLDENTLWIGTDKGLNNIDLTGKSHPVKLYTTGDGLGSDIINSIFAIGNMVYIGTNEGITIFDKRKISVPSTCNLLFTDISIGGQSYQPGNEIFQVSHRQNNLRFDYIGISYKSAGDIVYRYRLLGLDTTWQETRETYLSYPTLPSGNYELQIQAINKFNVTSNIISAGFVIEKLLIEKTWFRLLIGAVLFVFIAGLVAFIARRIRKREEEKSAVSKRVSDLEQLALKSQMNPHFIFNSLNSIQQYVMDKDIAGANKFISSFSRLIRQTLNFSSKQHISLAEELDYLTNYLELEKMRLENKFVYSVSVTADVQSSAVYLPPMFLQPFVENSVRHGIRFRKDKNGVIIIRVSQQQHYLVCTLEDNGVGRKAASWFKSNSPIEYQSKGMSLTADRVEMLNRNSPNKIDIEIVDLQDAGGNPLGTRIIVRFPILQDSLL